MNTIIRLPQSFRLFIATVFQPSFCMIDARLSCKNKRKIGTRGLHYIQILVFANKGLALKGLPQIPCDERSAPPFYFPTPGVLSFEFPSSAQSHQTQILPGLICKQPGFGNCIAPQRIQGPPGRAILLSSITVLYCHWIERVGWGSQMGFTLLDNLITSEPRLYIYR